jgi:hypothetical protein
MNNFNNIYRLQKETNKYSLDFDNILMLKHVQLKIRIIFNFLNIIKIITF